MKPKILILRAPGTNCDEETAYAFEVAGGQSSYVHINRLIEEPSLAAEFDILCLPGGFSYGDDIAAGKILASQLKHFLRDVIHEFQASGKLVLGICNGFQVLIKTGLLKPVGESEFSSTLTWNERGRYDCRWVTLKTGAQECVFLREIDLMYLPIAHAEGRFVARDQSIIDVLESRRQLALRYVNSDGSNDNVPYPNNPNGSMDNIAGVCDQSGRIFGLMPHPERYIDATQHPRWTREGLDKKPDGLRLFENAVEYFA